MNISYQLSVRRSLFVTSQFVCECCSDSKIYWL